MLSQIVTYVSLAASLVTFVEGGGGKHFYRRQDGPVPTGTISDCTYFVDAAVGDTCASITRDWGITEAQFLAYNPSVQSDCSGLIVGDSYCVEENYGNGPAPSSTATTLTTSATATTTAAPSPTQSGLVSKCNAFYKVVSGDECQAIVDSYGTFTLADFYSWNPAVGTSCRGLQAGYYVCVGVPGSTSTLASPTATTTATSTGPSPTQTGIISTCTSYYQAVSGDSCEGIANKYGTFTVAQFETWNPAVGSFCSLLIQGYYYCVGVPGIPTSAVSTTTSTTTTTTATGPTPTQTGIVSNCNQWYQAVAGDSCEGIANKYGTFTVATFESWNPAVGTSCRSLLLGDYYCVGTTTSPTTKISTTTAAATSTTASGPQPEQSGIASNCNKYYLVGSGDNCAAIETNAGITPANFLAWNKAINSACTNLLLGYYVCIGVS
ncbi:LysM domain-containing protein [Sclerotinia borealis F-4128]|uniref:LysM domain-containing protein n=1 Tax=Sclerotinia borealis (strain F-4128) TaxID=1432307 RepID=W9C730_SCLBF|nr:LysM domain-containing protein [Sclerotinia borealis F-4128]